MPKFKNLYYTGYKEWVVKMFLYFEFLSLFFICFLRFVFLVLPARPGLGNLHCKKWIIIYYFTTAIRV